MSTVTIFVGGVKYKLDTVKINRFPDTLLATKLKNNENDYLYTNRDGAAFAFIKLFYDTGALSESIIEDCTMANVSWDTLKSEFDYFKIPFEDPLNQIYCNLGKKFDSFIVTLSKLITKAIKQELEQFNITREIHISRRNIVQWTISSDSVYISENEKNSLNNILCKEFFWYNDDENILRPVILAWLRKIYPNIMVTYSGTSSNYSMVFRGYFNLLAILKESNAYRYLRNDDNNNDNDDDNDEDDE